MPAGSPPGGLDRRFFLGDRILKNVGTDTSVNFQISAFDPASGNIFVGGNNDYVGLLRDGIGGQLQQGTVLPATSNTWLVASGAVDLATGHWYGIDSVNAVFRMNPNLDGNAIITPPNVVARDGIVKYNGRIFVQHSNQTIPDRQIEFSDDNGLTWDSNPGIDTGQATNGNGLFTNINETLLLAIFAGGPNVATSMAVDGITGSWTLHPCGNAGLPMNDGAVSDNGLFWAVVSQNGDITTNTGIIDPEDNPFKSSANAGNSLESVTWVEALNGFFVCSNIGPYCGFIDAGNMSRCIVGSYMGNGVSIVDGAGVSDGEQLLVPGNANEAWVSLREIGQTGITA